MGTNEVFFRCSWFVAATLVAVGAAACHQDSERAQPEFDAGDAPDAHAANDDARRGDTGSAGGVKTILAKLTLVNATTDLGTNANINAAGGQGTRVCFAVGKADALTVTAYPPLPHEASASANSTPPAVFSGTGGVLPSFGLDLTQLVLQPYVMNARAMAAKGFLKPTDDGAEVGCNEILDTKQHPEVKEGEDYWVLDTIPAGTFSNGASYLLALTGCAGDATVSNTAKCGPGFTADGGPGRGNLTIRVYELERAGISATEVGVQFAQLSAQAVAQGLSIEPGFTADPRMASAYRSVTSSAVSYASLSPGVVIDGLAESDFFASSKSSPGAPERAFAPVPLLQIQALSGLAPVSAPTVYTAGKNFVFIAIGDPDVAAQPMFVNTDGTAGSANAGAMFNLRSYHYLAFPTDPDVRPFSP